MTNYEKITAAFTKNVLPVYLKTFGDNKNTTWNSFLQFVKDYVSDLDWLKEDDSFIAVNYTDKVVNYLNNLPKDMTLKFGSREKCHLPEPLYLVARAENDYCNN